MVICRGQDARGAAAVEFALIMPLMMMLVLGSLDWGYYFFVAQIVNNASREGARAGSLEVSDGAATSEAETVVASYLTAGGLDPSKATISASTTADSVQVLVVYSVGSLTGFSEVVVPTAARAQTEMRKSSP